jgi:hypothetical protein
MAQKPQQKSEQKAQQKPRKPVVSRSGTIAVSTNERGLPTALKIDPRELRRRPQALADEILALCRLSATRAQVAFRRDLVDQGYSPTVIGELGLPTDEQLAHVEEELYGGDDEPPPTWMRSV